MSQDGSMKPSRSEFVPIRGLRYHLRHWGRPGAPQIVMLHGWMDVSTSFQFIVDSLQRDWHVIAPDWRGFGLSEAAGSDCYWFADYLADLDALLAHVSPWQPVVLLGHSLGGNIAGLYAGMRPGRVSRLLNIEGYGRAALPVEQVPARYARWLDDLCAAPRIQRYRSLDRVVARLQKNNPRLSGERAAFLARHWARQDQDGLWEILADPAHKALQPVPFRTAEALACWRAITAPVLWLEGLESDFWHALGADRDSARAELDGRIAHIRTVQKVMIPEAGHMAHHDQPELVARAIEAFLAPT